MSSPPSTARSSLTLDAAQSAVDDWIRSIGVRYFSELTNLAQLVEEVGELARLMSRKYGDQSFKAGETPERIPEELGDILFVLLCLANQMQINLNDALVEGLARKSCRDARRHLDNPKLQPRFNGPEP
jgi:NTP pyrophosphatase (non-canonical NTP hydrolase)